MASKITLILGGARSGKSTFAEQLALTSGNPVTYLATADICDMEMEERVRIHKERRPADWTTWEGAPEKLPEAIRGMKGTLILDCLTMWLTRLMFATDAAESSDEHIWQARELEIRALTEQLCLSAGDETELIIVSNEVGYGIVPENRLARRFRDMQGRMNQLCGKYADEVALIVAGCPIWAKRNSKLL